MLKNSIPDSILTLKQDQFIIYRNELLCVLSLLVLLLPGFATGDTEVRGDVSGVWTVEGSPYIAMEHLNLPDGEQLSIEPGVEIRFNDNYEFTVYGQLEAVGTVNDSIRFQPSAEDAFWGGIRFLDADSLTRLDYCVLSYGWRLEGEGQADVTSNGGNIYIEGGDLRIEHTRISRGQARGFGGGICIVDSDPLIQQCLINENGSQENGGGVEVYRSASAVFRECRFTGNNTSWSGAGACVEAGADAEFDTCHFTENIAGAGGGAMAWYGGGGSAGKCVFLANEAFIGGAVYFNDRCEPLFDWCVFEDNRADEGGAAAFRNQSSTEMKYCRFKANNALRGGAIANWDEPASNVHHCLFLYNTASNGGVYVSNVNHPGGETPFTLINCTMIGNRAFRPEDLANVAQVYENSSLSLSNCIVWDSPQPQFNNIQAISISFSHIQYGYNGQGNSDANPGLFAFDSTWCLLAGESPCVDTGNPDLADDPDNTRCDRGWMYFPYNLFQNVDPNEFSLQIEAGQRRIQPVALQNTSQAPVFASVLDHWRESGREAMINVSSITGDRQIMCAMVFAENIILAGGNNGEDPNKIYILDRDFNLIRQFDQPGGIDGDGFLDLASDEENVIFAVDEEQISEFTLDGELGDYYEGPDAVRTFRGIGADFNYAVADVDFYIGGDEGYIVRTDFDFWESDRIQVGDTIRALAVKGNSRFLYAVSSPRPGYHLISIIDPTNRVVTPLYKMTPPNASASAGGFEITQDWVGESGCIAGIWRGNGENADDWLYISELYTSWLAVRSEWKMLMPGEEAEWEIEIAGDQVAPDFYQSRIYMALNGYGEEGILSFRLRVNPSDVKEGSEDFQPDNFKIFSISPNPGNGQFVVDYAIHSAGYTNLKVYNSMGNEVSCLMSGFQRSGSYAAVWNALNKPSGVYYVVLQQPERELFVRDFVIIR